MPGGQVADRAVTDLAGRLGVAPSEIAVLAARPRTWPDTGLGCPQPGVTYAAGPVEGTQVVLRHGDRAYLYHAGDDGLPFLCPSGEPDGGRDFVPPPGFDI